MNKKLTIIASAAIASLNFATSTIAVEPCKMYIKAQAGYAITNIPTYLRTTGTANPNSIDIALNGSRTNPEAKDTYDTENIKALKGFTGGMGFGYNINEMLRMDFTVDYYATKNKPKADSSKYYIDSQSIRGLANLYVDFNNSSIFTPFINVGIGVDSTRYKVKLPSAGTPVAATDSSGGALTAAGAFYRYVTFDTASEMPATTGSHLNMKTYITADAEKKGKRKSNIAYQAGLGLAIKVSEGIYFDAAYKFENMEKYEEFGDGGFVLQQPQNAQSTAATYMAVSKFKVKRMWKNSITGGLRFEF